MHTWDYLKEFIDALTKQLQDDEKRWGDTWLQRVPMGQEERSFASFMNKYDQWKNGGVPIPWLKIAGDAFICWIRDNHPELWNKG